MKKGIFLCLLFGAFYHPPVFPQDELAAVVEEKPNTELADIKAINFRQVGEISEIEFVLDSNKVPAKKFAVVEDKQIIVDIKGARATERVMRAFDTSEFSGSIVFVSAYQKPGSKDDVRIAIQLRDNVRSILKRKANRIVLEVENRFGVFDQRDISESKSFEEKAGGEETASAGRLLVPRSDAVEDILENLTLAGRKKYIGKRISLNVRNVAVAEILKMIAEASGFNIITTEEIKALPPLSLNLTNVPWDQVLDTILGLNKLVAKKNGIILMIQTLATATADKQKEAEAKLLNLKQEPLVTKVFPISYALTTDLMKILGEYLTPERGRISEDQRTNSLIVKDTPDVIEKLRKIIEVLDTQTPQVLIESRIVEVSESYSKSLGLENGLGISYDPVGEQSSTLVGVGQIPSGGTNNGGPGFSFNSSGGILDDAGNLGVMNLSIGQFGRIFDLNFRLQLLETESKGKIISSPKVVTQNKQEAKLTTKRTEAYLVVNGAGDTATTGAETTEAILELTVLPQITNEGSISLTVNVTKEDFAERVSPQLPPNKTTNAVQTNVLVDNGSTIVIGGVYEYNKRETISGIPYLKDIPILGWLFRNQYQPSTSKREVIIFITPRIINQEEAGLLERS
ncbi:MAG: type IV pilus secretin PilQ [Halobacteriovoraceae bacterium]|nr:type IV pilus secretin PilQ [Halobacteriovoraceae bacterium]